MLLYRFLLEIIPYFCVQVTCLQIILPRNPGPDWQSLPDQGLVGNNGQHSVFIFPGYVNLPRITSLPRNPVFKPKISTRHNLFVPDMSAIRKNCPLTATFCESVDNYPADYINNKLNENPEKYKPFFKSDVNINERIGVTEENDGYKENNDDFSDAVNQPFCSSVGKMITPAAGMNGNEEWKFIVNNREYVQIIRAEVCKSFNSSCPNPKDGRIQGRSRTTCKQRYVLQNLVALDYEGKIATESFKIPSCCVCVFLPKGLK